MAVSIKFDEVNGSKLEIEGQQGLKRKITRIGTVTGMPYSSSADASGLILSVVGQGNVPQIGSAHPNDSTFILRRIVFMGLSGTVDGFRVMCEYTNYTEAIVSSALIITSSTRTNTVSTNIHPITHKPIRVKYDSSDKSKYPDVPEDYVTINWRMPAQAVRISGVFYGQPSNTNANYVGYVNDAYWQGRPAGCWLLDEFETTNYLYQGYYTVNALAITKGPPPMDWSETAIMRNAQTGKHVTVDDSLLSSLMGYAYICGDYSVTNGLIRVGLYPTASFSSIFGSIVNGQ